MQYSFGSGALFGRSLTNSPATPVQFGALQGASIDISFTAKELHGGNQFPLALGRGKGKITGKADFAQINAQVFNDLFFGNANPASSSVRTSLHESATIASNIVTATYNTAYVADLGVIRASDGAVYTRVTSGPAGLQYSANETTGVYSFNTSQNAVAVLVSYTYTDASNGKKITLTNQALGNSPTFMAVFTNTFNSKSLTIVLNSCMSSKLSIATKLEDFTSPNFDFMAFADASGNIGTISTDE